MALVKFLKTENLTENVSEFGVGQAFSDLVETPIHSLLEFRGIFCL